MAKQSAGSLLYRTTHGATEVLLVHPGGPFWARGDAGAWSIPKDECVHGEDPRTCACGNFEEETGTALSPAELIELGSVRQKGGKVVTAGPPKAASTPTPSATPSRWSGLLARDPSPSSPRSIGPPGSTQTPHAASWVAAPAAFVDGLAERLR